MEAPELDAPSAMRIVHLPAIEVVSIEGVAPVAMTAARKRVQHVLDNVEVNQIRMLLVEVCAQVLYLLRLVHLTAIREVLAGTSDEFCLRHIDRAP